MDSKGQTVITLLGGTSGEAELRFHGIQGEEESVVRFMPGKGLSLQVGHAPAILLGKRADAAGLELTGVHIGQKSQAALGVDSTDASRLALFGADYTRSVDLWANEVEGGGWIGSRRELPSTSEGVRLAGGNGESGLGVFDSMGRCLAAIGISDQGNGFAQVTQASQNVYAVLQSEEDVAWCGTLASEGGEEKRITTSIAYHAKYGDARLTLRAPMSHEFDAVRKINLFANPNAGTMEIEDEQGNVRVRATAESKASFVGMVAPGRGEIAGTIQKEDMGGFFAGSPDAPHATVGAWDNRVRLKITDKSGVERVVYDLEIDSEASLTLRDKSGSEKILKN